MGLENWFWKEVTGVDLDAEQAKGDALDAQIKADDQANLQSGKWTQDQYDQAVADANSGATGDVTAQVDKAAVDGAKEGLQNLVNTVGDAAQGVTNWSFKSLFKIVPWQVWVAVPIILFFYLGGGVILKRYLEKKFAK